MSSLIAGRQMRIVAGLLLNLALLGAIAPLSQAFAQSPDQADSRPCSAVDVERQTVVTSDGLTFHTNTANMFTDGRPTTLSTSAAGSGVLAADLASDGHGTPLSAKPVAGFAPDSVIGADGRTQVNTTNVYPYRAIAYLLITWHNGSQASCTGWFIGPRTVATAGHCVYSHDSGSAGWAASMVVYPGRNGNSLPYGSASAHRFFSVTGWTNGSGDANYDYGAIQLNSTLGNTVGWFGFRWASNDSSFQNLYVRITGYPGDKPTATQWTMADGIQRVWSRRFFYAIDTAGGQSGSPVYHNYSATCNPCSVAIHTEGVGGDPNGQYNSGTRIVQPVFNNLLAWKNYAYP